MLKRVLPAAIVFLALWWLVWQSAKPDCFGNAQETLQQSWSGAGAYSLKIDRHSDVCGFGPSDSYYVFRVKSARSENWREIMTYRHDEAVNLENKWLRALSETTAYVYIFDRYAVTFDGGRTWNVWSASENVSDWKTSPDAGFGQATIEDVSLEENGVGTMTLQGSGKNKNTQPLRVLYTKDFGKTWHRSP